MPTNYLLANVFGRSPIEPIQRHITIVHRCVLQLEPLFQAAYTEQWPEAQDIEGKIKKLMHEEYDIKCQIRSTLSKNLLLPVSKTGLLQIVTLQESIALKAQEITSLLVSRQMAIPTVLQLHFTMALEHAVAISSKACRAIHELDELLEAGFRGREVEAVEDMIAELRQLEKESYEPVSELKIQLFQQEQTLPPVHVMFLYKVIDGISDLAHDATHVGAHLQLLLAN